MIKSKTFTIGKRVITLSIPRSPIRVSNQEEAFEFNGHLLTSHYGDTETDMWPTYALCFRCGHSFLGGAEAAFSAMSCKNMRREDGRRLRG
jgi:hypothetical protein